MNCSINLLERQARMGVEPSGNTVKETELNYGSDLLYLVMATG